VTAYAAAKRGLIAAGSRMVLGNCNFSEERNDISSE